MQYGKILNQIDFKFLKLRTIMKVLYIAHRMGLNMHLISTQSKKVLIKNNDEVILPRTLKV